MLIQFSGTKLNRVYKLKLLTKNREKNESIEKWQTITKNQIDFIQVQFKECI